MANKSYKIVVPKVGATNELGTESKLYVHNEVVEAKESWQQDLMEAFVANNWAMEIKVEDTSDLEQSEPVRARNEKGHYKADDPSTPDINEAYEGGVAPKKTTKKKSTKSTAKKSTKK
tara:strand:+ start:91 stop:444 length:354 start_codon:yes stop_codon:yes gene_type:complete